MWQKLVGVIVFFIIWPAEAKIFIYFNCLALTTLWITKIYPIHLKQLSHLISLKNTKKCVCFLLFDNTIVVFNYYIYGICFYGSWTVPGSTSCLLPSLISFLQLSYSKAWTVFHLLSSLDQIFQVPGLVTSNISSFYISPL